MGGKKRRKNPSPLPNTPTPDMGKGDGAKGPSGDEARARESESARGTTEVSAPTSPGVQRSKWTDPGNVINLILVAITGIAVITATYQARRAADLAAETLILSSRAWLHFEQYRLDLGGDRPHARFHIVNTGNRPATLQRLDWGFRMGTLPPNPNPVNNHDLSGIQVAPGADEGLGQDIVLGDPLLSDVKGAIANASPLWFFVQLTYHDGFTERIACSIVIWREDTKQLQLAPERIYHCPEESAPPGGERSQ